MVGGPVRPGGSGGGYHGGYHPGGGGYHGGSYYRPGYYPGYYRPGYGYGYGYGYPWGSIAIGVGLGLAANRLNGGYYGGGYYGDGYGYSSAYSNGAYMPDYGTVPSQNFYPPPAETAANAASARITITLPTADAKLWIDDYQSQKDGAQRSLVTPPLDPGQTYSYTLLALWNEDGRPVSRAREVRFQAGQSLVVDFTVPEPLKN
jgi:uncharacterized protein (TIGR03000 family)